MPVQWARFDLEIVEVRERIVELVFEGGVGEGVVVTIFVGG